MSVDDGQLSLFGDADTATSSTTTAPTDYPVLMFKEVLDEYEFVDTIDGTAGMIVTERQQLTEPKQLAVRDSSEIDLHEIGTASPSPFWGRFEYNNSLRGWMGVKKFDEMRRSDSTVSGMLDLAKTPVLGARWFIEPYCEPGKEPTARDWNAARHVWWNLTEGMTTSWPQFLGECLLMLDFGYYCFEKVFTVTHPLRPGMACWKKFAPRHPLDIVDWDYDENGGPAGIRVMVASASGSMVEQSIPISKLLAFTYKKEGGDMTGMSLLRSVFKPWYMKQNLEKIDAIQKERHGIGVPVIKLPPGFSDRDKLLAEQMGRNLRTNERAHIVLPPMWEIMFAKLEGQPVDTLASIQYHDQQIWTRILARFMASTNSTLKDDDRILFLQATRVLAEGVQDNINKYAIPQLVDYNWSRIKGYPKLRARRIGEQADWRTMSFALRNMIGAGVIIPDEKLEEQVRDEMDLPRADPSTARKQATPQGAPQTGQPQGGGSPSSPTAPEAGPPRQTKPSATPPQAHGGRDNSGG
jgi:hypothetical protein